MNTNNDGLCGELARGIAKARVIRRGVSLPAFLCAFLYCTAAAGSALIFIRWLMT